MFLVSSLHFDACSMQFVNMVTDLKAQAEALVLVANDADGLLTCALRPSYVFGPEDNYLSSLLVNVAKSGWAKVGSLLLLCTSCCVKLSISYVPSFLLSLCKCDVLDLSSLLLHQHPPKFLLNLFHASNL